MTLADIDQRYRNPAPWQAHRVISNDALSGFRHPALQLATTYSQIYAHEFEMGFYGEIQVRVLHGNAETMDRPIDAFEFGFERGNLRSGHFLLQARFDFLSRRYIAPSRYVTKPLYSLGV